MVIFEKMCAPGINIKMVRCMVLLKMVRFCVYIQIEQYHGKEPLMSRKEPIRSLDDLGRSYGGIDGE